MRRYREFIEDGFNMGRREDLTGGGLRRSAGSWGFWKELARYFGISRPSVLQAIKRGEKFAKENGNFSITQGKMSGFRLSPE
jgi:hypothetical protein